MPETIIIAHNIRSVLNLGSIFRTAEGFGVQKIYLSGYTANFQSGLEHIRQKMARQLHKTALGAEKILPSEYVSDVVKITTILKNSGYKIVGLEQDKRAVDLPNYKPPAKIALLLGQEVNGIEPQLLELCDDLVEIPMLGQKESFNVSVAAAIALYHLTTTQPSS